MLNGALSRLEPGAGKLARRVLRGPGDGNVTRLPDVRHEVARVLIKEHDPVFCHRYPTEPCVGGNLGVRSARNTVASV